MNDSVIRSHNPNNTAGHCITALEDFSFGDAARSGRFFAELLRAFSQSSSGRFSAVGVVASTAEEHQNVIVCAPT